MDYVWVVLVEVPRKGSVEKRGVAVATDQKKHEHNAMAAKKTEPHDGETKKLGKEIEKAEREEDEADDEEDDEETADS